VLEEQFAQVRLALRMKFDCSEHGPTVAALSAIEQWATDVALHVQDMETALRAYAEEFEDTYREFFNADDDEARQCRLDFEAAHGLAPLPASGTRNRVAREKGTE
jgi:hypothetical protein